MCLAISNNLLLVLQDAPKRIFSMNLRSTGQPKNDAKTLFSHPPSDFHGNFCNCNSIGICTAFVILGSTSTVIHSMKQRLLRNRPGSALRPLATSCAKDYKARSLQQTSFAESPNITVPEKAASSFTSLYGTGLLLTVTAVVLLRTWIVFTPGQAE